MDEENEIEELESQGEQPKKKAHTRNMNKQEKLVLIRECCKHADEYLPLNKIKFWAMISSLLKQQTGYDLVNPA